MAQQSELSQDGAGQLYVVATPIGNLEDLSPRVRRILGEVALIAAEDTRRTRELLSALDLRTPLISVHEHNELERIPELLAKLAQGQDLALVSDAGAPTISDPGMPLVRAVVDAGGRVVPIPGPSAVIAALSASGLATDRFLFLGFLPAKASRRSKALAALAAEQATLVLFEGKARVVDLLRAIESELGVRQVAVCRELTKMHEEILRGSAAQVADVLEGSERLRGEFTLVVEGASESAIAAAASVSIGKSQGVKDLAAEVARVLGVKKRDAYQALLNLQPGGDEG